MSSIVNDIRYAIRALARSRAFTVAALLTLMLGIGATTSIFSVLWAVVFQPLPYRDPSRLMMIWETDPHNGLTSEPASLPDMRDFQARSKSFERISGFHTVYSTLSDPSREAERVTGARALWSTLHVFGVSPLLGRMFAPGDDVKNAAPVVIISEELWRNRYAAAPILDRNIMVDGKPHRVIGVMPRKLGTDFDTGDDIQLWMPYIAESAAFTSARDVHQLVTIARLKPNATRASAQAELTAIMAGMARVNTEDAGRGIRIEPFHDAIVGDAQGRLFMLGGAVSLVLLIGCLNVAGLMLARGNSRSRELAIRASLGASRGRVARQLFIESLVLSLGGAILGIGFTVVATRALVSMLPQLPRAGTIGLNTPVLAFAIFTAVFSAVLFGLAPSLRASRSGAFRDLRGRSHDPRRAFGRSILVVIELALAMVLVVGAGLFLTSLTRLLSIDPGFKTDHVLTASIALPSATYPVPGKEYPKWPTFETFYNALLSRLRAIPGVEKASLAQNHPFDSGWTTSVSVEGVPDPPAGSHDDVRVRGVSSQYFEALGIPLLRGRTFDDRDRAGGPETVIVNDAFVHHYFPHADPIGKHFTLWRHSKEIVGVVRGERFGGLDREAGPAIYPVLDQNPQGGMTIVMRVSGTPMSQAGKVRTVLHSIDSGIAVSNVEPVDARISQSTATPRFQTTLVSLFGIIAMILAAVGLYGLIAYQVQQRTREIGIRVALGAQQSGIAILIVKQGLTLALIGIVIGIGAALSVTRFIASALFSISATDPAVFAMVAATLTLVALVASYIPARRAARVDPSVALRYE